MKKNYVRNSMTIVVLLSLILLNLQCRGQANRKETKCKNCVEECVNINAQFEKKRKTKEKTRPYIVDSSRVENGINTNRKNPPSQPNNVIWEQHEWGGFSSYLCKESLDTTNYHFRSEKDHVLINNYINSEEVKSCMVNIQTEFIRSLNMLSKDQINTMMGDTAHHRAIVLISFLLNRYGMIEQIRFDFLRAKRKLPDFFIRDVDEKIRMIKFPTLNRYGLDNCNITMPIDKYLLHDYCEQVSENDNK